MKTGKSTKKIRVSSKNDSVTQQRLRVFDALNRFKAEYVLIGGVACNFHGLVRATKDLDLLIPRGNIKNTSHILDALKESQTWGLVGELDVQKVAKNPFTIIGDQPRVDLLTIAGKVRFEQAILSAVKRQIDGVTICFADINTLIRTKDTDRTSDLSDVEQLKEIKKQTKNRQT